MSLPLNEEASSAPCYRRRHRHRRRCVKNNLVVSITSLLLHTGIRYAHAQCNPCDSNPDGYAVVPFTGCSQYVSCQGGVQTGGSQSCNSGLIFDPSIKGCNWDYQVTCPADPTNCGGDSSVGEAGANVQSVKSGCDLSSTPLCGPTDSSRVIVPFTQCNQYVQCSNGVPGTTESCPPGQMYSTQIQACNIIAQVVCPPDPTCPPTVPNPPTASPTITRMPVSPEPTEEPTEKPASPKSNEPFVTPDLLEGVYVMDAHLDANKILISRELFNGGRPLTSTSSTFDYNSFKNSLHTMITTPIDDKSFYIGSSEQTNGRVYGLVNIAAFLSQAVVDSIRFGSCDEVNSDTVNEELPLSNACGQNGMDYQDVSTLCLASEEKYACDVEWEMRVQGGNVGTSPPPFYCGPADDYGGYTGHWDFASGMENKDGPTANAIGKTDVQGCCWWGRGVIQTRGICQYGKLNHFLGKKSADDGGPSMFPDVDFCLDPGAVCSNEQYPDMKWITGLFRWIMDVQTYDVEEFSYMNELIKFVDGGFEDWSFIHRVSGIVTQGCHKPPCVEGAEFNSSQRKDAFVKTLKLFGLRVNDASENSRRLESPDTVLDR